MNRRFSVTEKKRDFLRSYALEGKLDVYCIPKMGRLTKITFSTEEGKTQPKEGESCTSIVTGSSLKQQVMWRGSAYQ